MKLRSFTALLLILTMALGLTALAADFDAKQVITVVSREEGSGTRGAFVELTGVLAKDDSGEEKDNTYSEAIVSNGTNLVLTTVADNQAAIGYASLSSVLHNDTVKALKVEGVEASTENILNGTYKIARPFNVVTNGELTDRQQVRQPDCGRVHLRCPRHGAAGRGLHGAEPRSED